MEENKKDVLPLEGEPLTAPQISEPVVNALAAALSKIETYVPTQYVDDGPPDIDADHLNHAEQAIMRVTNLANGAADAIAALQSQVTQLNNNLSGTKITVDILSDALIAGDGIHEYNLNGLSYTGNLPESNYAYGNGTVYRRNKSSITVVLYGGTQEPIATNYSSDGKTWRGWKVHALKSDLGDLITHRKTTGNTSDSGNITINRPEGYSLIGAYINSVYVRLSIPTVYQKTIIVRCFDENMSPLKNTLVEVISLWIKKDISY